MTTTMENAKTRLESIKAETNTAIEDGRFDASPADAEGITPKERLTWVAPSIDYIIGVAAGLQEADVKDALGKLDSSDEDELMFNYIGVVEALTKDQYVSEGKYNLQMALDILKADGETDGDDDADETESESALDKLRGTGRKIWGELVDFFSKPKDDSKKKAAKPVTSDSEDTEAKLHELENLLAKLKAEKADIDARAEKAEAEAKVLRAKLESMGINT